MVVLGLAAACEISDASSPSPAVQPATSEIAPSSAAVKIVGIANFRQTALVLTDACRTVKYETDRQAVASAAITKALEPYASALPGGLTVDIQPMSLRMRCHSAGLAALQSYCAAEANVTMIVSGNDRSGQAIIVNVSKEATERAQQGLICISTMPAVTAAVDKALSDGLIDVQSGLSARTGIPLR